MNPRVARIIDVKPFLITVEWTNGEKKSIDFAEFLADEKNKKSVFSRLLQKEIFSQVKTDGRTLYWDSMTEMIDTDGSRISAPIDFCPDVLYGLAKKTS
jgi:hypothetical protein